MRFLWFCLLVSGCATPPPHPALLPLTPSLIVARPSLAALRDAAQDADAFAPSLGSLLFPAPPI